MPKLNNWLGRSRGAAVTEKLVVVMFAIILIGSAMAIFGPMLAQKYAFVGTLLGMDPEPMRTLADGVEREGTNPIWYVVFTFAVAAFFAVFIAPLMFPRARHTRQAVILDAVERFPFLAPLIDLDKLNEARMRELRALGDEVNALHQHRAGALDIQPHDFGKMASPVEQTVDASFSEMPDLEQILAGADPERAAEARRLAQKPAAAIAFDGGADQSEETQMSIPMSQRLKALRGDDEIPFDMLDPKLKPQLQSSEPRMPPRPPRPPRPRNPSRGVPIVPSDDSTTVDVGSPDEVFENPDALAAQILRQSGALPAMDESQDATIIRDSQPLPGIVGVDDTDAETGLVSPLDRRYVKSGPLASTSADSTTPDRLDQTTQDYDSYE